MTVIERALAYKLPGISKV